MSSSSAKILQVGVEHGLEKWYNVTADICFYISSCLASSDLDEGRSAWPIAAISPETLNIHAYIPQHIARFPNIKNLVAHL